jgi:hypothetical protein
MSRLDEAAVVELRKQFLRRLADASGCSHTVGRSRIMNAMTLAISARTLFLAAGICAGLGSESAAAHLIIHVTPSASAKASLTDSGKDSAPVSLSEALGMIKAPNLRDSKGALKEDVTIHLEAGAYRVDQTISIDATSSGSADHPLTIEGAQDASSIISGGKPVNGFASVIDKAVLARLPEAARAHVLQADLTKQGISNYGSQTRHGFGIDAGRPTGLQVFYRGHPMTLARWPNHGFAKIAATPDGEHGFSFSVQGANLAAWQNEPHLLATGYWFHNWADATIPIRTVDVNSQRLVLSDPGSPYGIKAGQPVFLQNALAELDQPGEWYLDEARGVLYFWPPGPINQDDVEVSVLEKLLVIDGAAHIRITGVTFAIARGDAITVSGGHDVTIANSVVRDTGNRAAVISGQNNGLTQMLIEDIGEGGVVLAGGDRQTLTPANLYVEHSTIRRFARVSRTYQPGVLISGVGNRAVSNRISDTAHTAIFFSGNDHLISRNEISDVCKESDDAGAIYTGRDWTARGTVISYNHIHDIENSTTDVAKKFGVMGVYLDDQASGISIRGNLFERVQTAVYIGGGRDNELEGNVFSDTPTAIHLDAEGVSWNKAQTDDPNGPLRKRLKEVPYNRTPYKERYPHLANILEDEPGAPKYNVARRNRFDNTAAVRITRDAVLGISINDIGQKSPQR